MKHSVQKYLFDVLLSINDIETYAKDVVTYLDIEDNQLLFDALCRRFSIIGEAIYQADKISNTLEITNKNKIKGLRHIIVHDYDTVLPEQIFLIIKKQLSILKLEITKLLVDLDPNIILPK